MNVEDDDVDDVDDDELTLDLTYAEDTKIRKDRSRVARWSSCSGGHTLDHPDIKSQINKFLHDTYTCIGF